MKILYITTNFETITHTFITREVEKVRLAGNDVELLALREIKDSLKTEYPECDISGCRYIYPVNPILLFSSVIKEVFKNPVRFFTAFRKATSDSNDSFMTKAKLVFQLSVATTQVKWIDEQEFDHIHAHFASPPTTFAMFFHFLTGIPYSFTGHAADIFRDTTAITTKVANATGIVCISEYNRNYFKKLVPDLPPTEMVHCGINLSEFIFQDRFVKTEFLTVLAVGRCVPKKGFHDLLLAFNELNNRGIKWQGVIAGSGPLLEALKEKASELNIDKQLVFLGNVSQKKVMELISNADIFVLPSVPVSDGDIDGIPVSLMEAMAMGCPVISTFVSGIPELISNEESGLLVEPGDPKALAGAIERLGNSDDLYARVARGGRAKIEDSFDLSQVGVQLSAFFENLVCLNREK